MALAKDRPEIAVHFQPVPHLVFGSETDPTPNVLRLQLDPDRMSLRVNINGAGAPFELESVELDRDLAPQDLSAYARLILNVLEGDPTLSIRGDEAEESWRIVEPILGAWAAGRVPLGTYPAGAANPAQATRERSRKMSVLTNEVPVELLSPHEPPCLSLYQPTHRRHP